MQDKGISPAVDRDNETDRAIMDLLLIDSPGPWAVEEVAREIGNANDATDGLARLERAGLIHRLEGFVFPTRTAAHAAVLAGS
jgi:hypothetical protein